MVRDTTVPDADCAVGTTEETAQRLRALGCRATAVLPAIAISAEDIRPIEARRRAAPRPFRVISVGDLVHWKGFELGLKAFASLAAAFVKLRSCPTAKKASRSFRFPRCIYGFRS